MKATGAAAGKEQSSLVGVGSDLLNRALVDCRQALGHCVLPAVHCISEPEEWLRELGWFNSQGNQFGKNRIVVFRCLQWWSGYAVEGSWIRTRKWFSSLEPGDCGIMPHLTYWDVPGPGSHGTIPPTGAGTQSCC